MLLLKQDTTKRRWIDNKALLKPEKYLEFDVRGDKEYEVKAIIDSTVYGQQINNNQIPGFYYFILWKGYLEKKNTWEPSLAVIHLWKLISTFHKKHPEKPTATALRLDSAPPMVRPMVSKKQQPE